MKESENLEGKSLADDLDNLFRSGQFNNVFKSLSNSPPPQELQPLINEKSLDKITPYFDEFVDHLYKIRVLNIADRRAAAKRIRQIFKTWQNEAPIVLSKNKLKEEAEIIKNLSLKHLAEYAKKQHEEFSKKAAVPDGKLDPKRARALSNYWSTAEEYISPASDPD